MTATRNAYTYRSAAWPNGCNASAGRRARRPPISSNSWFAESATECTPSASIDAEPVIAAATNFAAPIARFAPNAVTTARVLSSLAIGPLSTTPSTGPGVVGPPAGSRRYGTYPRTHVGALTPRSAHRRGLNSDQNNPGSAQVLPLPRGTRD